MYYPKPVVHMIDIRVALRLSRNSPYEVFKAIVQIAEDNGVTPNEVDKALYIYAKRHGCSYNEGLTLVKAGKKRGRLAE